MQSKARQDRGRVPAETLPLKRSSVGGATDSVVTDVVVVAVAVAVGGEGVAGAAVGEMLGSALVGDAAAATLSTGFMAKRSSSGAMLALPSDVAQGSLLGRVGGWKWNGEGLLNNKNCKQKKKSS